MRNLTVYCDGGSRGNPGPSASAFVIYEEGKVVAKGSKFFPHSTNNFAEYNAVLLALEWLKGNKVNSENAKVLFTLDSELVTKQLNGDYKIKNEVLKTLAVKVKSLVGELGGNIFFTHTLRAGNAEADALVNLELDRSH